MMVDCKYQNLLVARFVSEYILALQKVYKRDPLEKATKDL